ncbi:MAG: hypothetical protein ACREIU_03570 [Planctomycetota bacterium]
MKLRMVAGLVAVLGTTSALRADGECTAVVEDGSSSSKGTTGTT